MLIGHMNRILSILVVACTLGFPLATAKADPSFACSGNLNRTERQICDDVLLGDLDSEMARFYFQARGRTAGAARDDLASEQRLWLDWRNTCGRDGQCIRRRYEQRILDLAPADELPPAWRGGDALNQTLENVDSPDFDRVVDRRVTDARYEVEFADGTIRWQALNGGSVGTISPDGTETMNLFSQSPPPEFPSLPGTYASWGDSVETQLLRIIDHLLSPADRGEYRNLTTSKPYSIRVYNHLRVIDFLAVP